LIGNKKYHMKGLCVIYYGQIQMVSPPSVSEVQPSTSRLDIVMALQESRADIRYSRMGDVTSRSWVLIWNRCCGGELEHPRVWVIADQ